VQSLYLYLHGEELQTWRRTMRSLCEDRLRAFQYFVEFSIQSVRTTAAFGTTAQVMLRRGVMPTIQEFAAFNVVNPPSEWIDQILFYPRVLGPDRAAWQNVSGFMIAGARSQPLRRLLLHLDRS
jgi:hypothetical protein